MNHAEEIWKTLVRASVDKKHAWRTVGFSTSGPQGPQVRSVILRAAYTAERKLVFFTDRRSQKITDIEHDPRVALLFWNPRSSTQLRVCGMARLEASEMIVSGFWDRIPDYARKDYASLSAPGSLLDISHSEHGAESAKNNFAVLNVVVQTMELLRLDRAGHIRVRIQPDGSGGWGTVNLVP